MQRHLTVTRTLPESRALFRQKKLSSMPMLRIKGRWLDRAGFAIGSSVRVLVRDGVMILEVMNVERD